MKLPKSLCLALCIVFLATSTACVEIKERIFPGKKGRGELQLELDLTYFEMFAETGDWREKIGGLLQVQEVSLSELKGISQVQTSLSSEEKVAHMSLNYGSIEALNEALTFLYLGEEQPTFTFFEQVEDQWIRNQPPGWGKRVKERWEQLWGEELSPENQQAARFRYVAKLKASIGLVYAPFEVEIKEENKEVVVVLDASDLFEDKSSQIKILTK